MNLHKTKLLLKVIPGASKDAIIGYLGDRLKIKVSAPPESGKANKAVQTLLANKFNIPKQDIEITSGQQSPLKTITITGISTQDIEQALFKKT